MCGLDVTRVATANMFSALNGVDPQASLRLCGFEMRMVEEHRPPRSPSSANIF